MDLVEPYVLQNGLPFLVASGSSSSGDYGVSGIPHSFLIDAEGKLAWHGNPAGLSKGAVKKALKGAKRPKGDFLAVRIDEPVDARGEKARKLAEDGELAAALKEVAAILADESATGEQKQGAATVQSAVEAHVALLTGQAEQFIKDRDLGKALTILEALGKEFGASETGEKSRKRVEEIHSDPQLKAEMEAAKAWTRLQDQIRELKPAKARPKIEDFVKKYTGTKAADRARAMLGPGKSK